MLWEHALSRIRLISPQLKNSCRNLDPPSSESPVEPPYPTHRLDFVLFSRDAAMRLNVFSEYTYTLETIIQAGQKGIPITSVPIRTNADLRPSRLFKSMASYVRRSLFTIVRIFMTYRPLKFFLIPGTSLFVAGFLISLRFLYFFITEGGAGHIQSIILAALLMGAGFFLVVMGLFADLISVNRKLLEKHDWYLQQIHFSLQNDKKDK